MKPFIKQTFILGVCFLFCSCSSPKGESSLISSSSSASLVSSISTGSSSLSDLYPFKAEETLVFTEFVAGSSPFNRAVEISSIASSSIDLSSYKIIILPNKDGSGKYEIPLSGELKPGESYVVSYKHERVSEEIKKRSNLQSEDFWNIGAYPMIIFHDGFRIDTLGTLGYRLSYGEETTLVRKNEFMVGREASISYDWVNFHVDDFTRLGTKECPFSENELLSGPRLTDQSFLDPYFVSDSVGGGGVRKVTLNYGIDGDTAKFNLPSEFSSRGHGGVSTRFLGIDTPEIQHGTYIDAQPWGYAAKTFTTNKLSKAKSIAIQSPKGSVTDTYGRLLSYVWISDKADAKPEDYRMLNNEIVVNGYSKASHINLDESNLVSNGISFGAYLSNSDYYAAKLGLKVHGEKDPDFPY